MLSAYFRVRWRTKSVVYYYKFAVLSISWIWCVLFAASTIILLFTLEL